MKRCTKCGIEQNLDQFYPRSDRPGKFRAHCKTCLSEKAAHYYQENKDEINVHIAKYRSANGERLKQAAKRYQLAHKDKYYQNLRRWEDNNRERSNAKRRRYYRNHSELERYRRRKFGKLHPEKSQEYHGLRRARKQNNPHERLSYKKIWKRDKGICYLCGQSVEQGDVHFDHVVPLSRGGSHTMDNVRVTHKTCNLRKNNKTVEEYNRYLLGQVGYGIPEESMLSLGLLNADISQPALWQLEDTF